MINHQWIMSVERWKIWNFSKTGGFLLEGEKNGSVQTAAMIKINLDPKSITKTYPQQNPYPLPYDLVRSTIFLTGGNMKICSQLKKKKWGVLNSWARKQGYAIQATRRVQQMRPARPRRSTQQEQGWGDNSLDTLGGCSGSFAATQAARGRIRGLTQNDTLGGRILLILQPFFKISLRGGG